MPLSSHLKVHWQSFCRFYAINKYVQYKKKKVKRLPLRSDQKWQRHLASCSISVSYSCPFIYHKKYFLGPYGEFYFNEDCSTSEYLFQVSWQVHNEVHCHFKGSKAKNAFVVYSELQCLDIYWVIFSYVIVV